MKKKPDPAALPVMYGVLAAAIHALYKSHPRPAELRRAFDAMKKDYLDDLLQQSVEDETIAAAEKMFAAIAKAIPKTRV